MNTFLQPEVEILEGTYIDITYPDEIFLPGNLNQSTDMVKGEGTI
jgi:hypothetical protein